MGSVLAMLALVGGTVYLLQWLGEGKERFPDLRASVALPLLLLVGLGSLLLFIVLIVAVLSSFGLTDKGHAFGLPDGTMQAVIALALILIFIISSLYLYSSLPDTITNATRQAAQNKQTLAQQLLTTVGTLAVAVAGFYFGNRAVATAAAAQPGAVAATLRIIWPQSSPVWLPLTPGTNLEPILVETEPSDRRIKATVTGDEQTALQELTPGMFRYTRGPSAATAVVLSFSFLDDTEKKELEVRDEATKPATGTTTPASVSPTS